MHFETPENMAHLAQILRQALLDVRRSKSSLQSGAGAGASELIRSAYEYEYSGSESSTSEVAALATARGAKTLEAAQRLAQALTAAEVQLQEMISQVRKASQAVQEADARIATKVAAGNKYRL